MRVAITGGRGFVGRHLGHALREAGHSTISIVRDDPHDLREHGNLREGEEAAVGLSSSTSLTQAFSECDVLIHCAGINRERREQTYQAVHVEGTRNVLAAARQAKIKKVLLTSFLRARPNCGSDYHESKWEAEQLVRSSGLDYTIFKSGVLYGPGDQLTTRLGEVLQRIPLFAGVGFKDSLVRPVAIADLVTLMLASLEDPRLARVTVPVMGPETMPLSEMVKRIGQSRGVNPLVVPMPVPFHRLLAWFFEQLMEVPLVTMAQVRMLAEGLAEPVQPYDELASDLQPSTPFLRLSGL